MNKKLTSSILLIVFGILCIIFKQELIRYLISGVGLSLIIFGIIDLTKDKTNNGIIEIVLGILVIAFSWLILEVCLLLIGRK